MRFVLHYNPMHLRKKPWARPELQACPYFEADPESCKGTWQSKFPVEQPMHLEVGCGKGVSTAKMVFSEQNINFIALDVISDILGYTRRNIAMQFANSPIHNVWLTRYNVDFIKIIFSKEDKIERLYIHFCNPWSERKKHYKRRLTHPRQLEQYKSFLTPDAEIWFKTDSDSLFADSLTYFEQCGFSLTYCTYDLHNSGFSPNYISEHEAKYMSEGIPIKFLIVKRA